MNFKIFFYFVRFYARQDTSWKHCNADEMNVHDGCRTARRTPLNVFPEYSAVKSTGRAHLECVYCKGNINFIIKRNFDGKYSDQYRNI